jgi:hypothetical protein
MVKIAASQTTDGPAGDLQRPLGELFGSSVQRSPDEYDFMKSVESNGVRAAVEERNTVFGGR